MNWSSADANMIAAGYEKNRNNIWVKKNSPRSHRPDIVRQVLNSDEQKHNASAAIQKILVPKVKENTKRRNNQREGLLEVQRKMNLSQRPSLLINDFLENNGRPVFVRGENGRMHLPKGPRTDKYRAKKAKRETRREEEDVLYRWNMAQPVARGTRRHSNGRKKRAGESQRQKRGSKKSRRNQKRKSRNRR